MTCAARAVLAQCLLKTTSEYHERVGGAAWGNGAPTSDAAGGSGGEAPGMIK